jgi:hypothetical protein
MARLPNPGSDDGVWGEILNEFLEVEHNADGTLIRGAEFAAKYDKPVGGIPSTDLSSGVQASLTQAGNALPTSGGTLTGDLIFPATGFIMNDGANHWRVTIDSSGTILTTKLSGPSGESLIILQGFASSKLILQGF